MARSYKRDQRGRFATVGSRIVARRVAKKKARAEYVHGKKFNRQIAAYAVQSGKMSKSQAGKRLREVQADNRAAYKNELRKIKGSTIKR